MVRTVSSGQPHEPGQVSDDFKQKQEMLVKALMKNPSAQKTHEQQSVINPKADTEVPPTGALTSKEEIKKSGGSSDTERLRSDIKKTGHFLSGILAFFGQRSAISIFLLISINSHQQKD